MDILRRLLPRLSALFCAVLLVLLLIDVIWPGIYLFDNPFTKFFVLIACLLAALTGFFIYARQREQLRRRRR